ncbi:MAG: hypothetical protein ACW960_08950, partial [Candidatus Thorarchaeota archaeon]
MKNKNRIQILGVLLFALFLSSTLTVGPSILSVSESTLAASDASSLPASYTETESRLRSQPHILVYNEFADLSTGITGEFRNTLESIK